MITFIFLTGMSVALNTEMVKRMRNGDENAFKELFEAYNAQLLRFVFRFLKSREQSEDLLQEVFIKLWQNRETLDEQYSIEAYLYTIAKRLTLNQLRKATNGVKAKEHLWKMLSVFSNETEDAVLLSDLRRYTEEALAKLPEQQQLVFRLSRFEGLSHEEIAKQLQISPNTVKNHLSAALKTLRSALGQSGLAAAFFIYFFKIIVKALVVPAGLCVVAYIKGNITKLKACE